MIELHALIALSNNGLGFTAAHVMENSVSEEACDETGETIEELNEICMTVEEEEDTCL